MKLFSIPFPEDKGLNHTAVLYEEPEQLIKLFKLIQGPCDIFLMSSSLKKKKFFFQSNNPTCHY